MKRILLTALVLGASSIGTVAAAAEPATSTITTTSTATATPTTGAPVTTSTATTTTPPAQTTTTTAGVLDVNGPPPPVQDLPTQETESPINRPMLLTSAIVLGATYAVSAGFAYSSDRKEDQTNLYYPVAGPWMDLAQRDCVARACTNETLNKGLLIADGIGQGLAALGVVTSFFIPEKTTRHWYLIGDGGFTAGPSRVGSGYGLGATGKF